jgi:hypothetical protein
MAVENSRLGRFTESFLQATFPSLPYGRPVIGTVDDFERLGRREVCSLPSNNNHVQGQGYA